MNTNLGRTECAVVQNKSGGNLVQGDVVIVDTANANAFTTTTTSGYVSGRVGVILDVNGIADNAYGMVAFSGYVPKINLSGTGSIGDLVKTHTVAGQGVRHASPLVSGDFAQVLGTSATPDALLMGSPILADSGGGVFFSPTGLTGATAASRYVGATLTGSPVTGAFEAGDWIVTHDGHVWICSVAGSPGTWIDASSGGGGGGTDIVTQVNTYIAENNSDPIDTIIVDGNQVAFVFLGSSSTPGWTSASSSYVVPVGKKLVAVNAMASTRVVADTGYRRARLRNSTDGVDLFPDSYDSQLPAFPWDGDLGTPSSLPEAAAGKTIVAEIYNADGLRRAIGAVFYAVLVDP